MTNEYAATRAEARQRGDKFYKTGKPCKRGHVSHRDVSSATCRECHAESESRRYASNGDAIRENARNWYYENRDRVIQKVSDWRQENRDYYLRAKRKRHEQNRDRDRESIRAWQRENPDSLRAIRHRYRARKNENGKPMSSREYRSWEESQDKVCFYCDTDCSGGYHVDHFYPIAKGGVHQSHNLVIACPTCNLSKGDRDPDEFIQKLSEKVI